MTDKLRDQILTELAQSLDIPDTAYEAAQSRYHDLGEWLRDDSKAKSAQFKPLVSPQGSFRLGTVTKPWKRDEYDLALACNLQAGIGTETFTQYQLKQLVGNDLSAYRAERRIQDKLEEKHRCWRLRYQDHLNFHLDAVPCIPHTEHVRKNIEQRMIQAGTSASLAQDVAALAVAITDDRHRSYQRIANDWDVSNPEGFARWFESRMKLAHALLESRAIQAKVGRIEELPVFRWKTPLQTAIQILKRHRDVMYEHEPDRKPISIIITTLAAQAYQGEVDLAAALGQILSNMHVNPSEPRVPNPVNPQEDFADRWKTPEGRRLQLEDNFVVWLGKAKHDLTTIFFPSDYDVVREQVQKRFGVLLSENASRTVPGDWAGRPTSLAVHVIRDAPPKPWRL